MRQQTLSLLILVASTQASYAAASDTTSSITALPTRDAVTVTHHTARVRGRNIRYTATAGTITLTNAQGQPSASMFYVAYSADGLAPKERRPLTFAFNGGPGGSSAVINLGAFGPRTMVIANGTAMRAPPYDIVDNADSLLATSDLVFIDAIGTGFSRLVGAGAPKAYYGVDQDAKAFLAIH